MTNDFAMKKEKIHIAIIEDDSEICNGLHAFLSTCKDFDSIWMAGSVELFLEELHLHPETNIVLTDIGLPGKSGIEGIRLIREQIRDCNIIMLTVFNDEDKIFKSLCAGASGYLLKNTALAQIAETIRVIAEGGSYMSPTVARKVVAHFNPKPQSKPQVLTQREKQIVQALSDGLSYKLIADRLLISIDGVRYHIRNIYSKLHVNSKGEVISQAIKNNLF